MAENFRDNSGLSELRLRPSYEENQSPFSIFREEPPETLITGYTDHYFPPFNAITADSSHMTFIIPPFSNEYVKLNSFRAVGSARIMEVTQTGVLKTPGNVDLSVVNTLPTSIFDKVTVKLNNLELDSSGSSNSYGYKVSKHEQFSIFFF